MLLQLGVRKLILTCAAGSLQEHRRVGDIVVMDGFVTTCGAPIMPLWAGEFCSAEDALGAELRQLALDEALTQRITATTGGYAMYRGPGFEGRRYDKAVLTDSGAAVVGMSVVPEAYIAALYEADVLGLAFITNSTFETHSHEANLARVREASGKLGRYLTALVQKMSTKLST